MKNKFSALFSLAPSGLLWQSMLAAASAFLLTLSFPNFAVRYLAWAALTPLLWVIVNGVDWRRALWLGWLTGTLFTFFAENWIAHSMTHYGGMVTVIAYAVAFFFAMVLGLFPALFAAVQARLVNVFGTWALVFAPFIWAATEWVRPFITGVTWNALGVSQVQEFSIARLAQYGGVYLLSAMVVTGNVILVLLFRAKDKTVGRAAALLLLAAAVVFYAPTLAQQQTAQLNVPVKVLGVQPNVPVDLPPDEAPRYLEKTIALTREAIARTPEKRVDLVVWAESPLALFYDTDQALRERLNKLAQETGSYFIINSVAREGDRYFNSVTTISPHADAARQPTPLQRYDKMRLAPFGEYVPWRPLLGRFVPVITGDFTPGNAAVVNLLRLDTERAGITLGGEGRQPEAAIERTTNFVRTGAFICYEAAYPNLVRQFVQNGATLLVNVSEDGWFGNTAGARQHLMHALLRAIENDRDVVRVANTGITALLTADGRVVDPLPLFTEGTWTGEAQTRSGKTFYARYGDRFAALCAALSAGLLLLSFVRRR